MTTAITAFSRRVPPVNFDKVTPPPFGLVLKLPDKFRPRRIADAPGQITVLEHSRNVQVFDYNRLVFTNESITELMQEIKSGISDFLVGFRHTYPLLLVTLGTLLLACKPALLLGKLGVVIPTMLGRGNLFTRRESSEGGQTEVDTHRTVNFGKGFYFRLEPHGDVVPTGRGLGNSHRSDLVKVNRPVENYVKWFLHFGKVNLTVPNPERRAGVFSRLLVTTLLELGVLGTLVKEVLKRCLQVPQTLLDRYVRYIFEPRVFIRVPELDRKSVV